MNIVDRRKHNQDYLSRPTEDSANLDDWSPHSNKKIISFPKQLELPLVWWAEPNKWRERMLVSTTERPTEDTALDNVYYASLMRSNRLKIKLAPHERNIYRKELESHKKLPRYANEDERAKWVARQLGVGVQYVLDTLETVRVIMTNQDIYESLFDEQVFIEAVKEVLSEDLANRAIAA